MYEAYFGLKENPFTLSPDPRYLYLSPQHQEALNCLIYGIGERKGFMIVTGGIGTGKTTLCRALLAGLDSATSSALIFNPALSDLELLKTITQEFRIRVSGWEARTKKNYLDALNRFLMRNFAAGKNTVLIIDEAQNLSHSVLEQIRMISNLETVREKLIQIVLLGQPELRALLALPSLRQLNERITVRYDLRPLARDDIRRYIEHRMKTAGSDIKSCTFTTGSYDLLYDLSRGIPRRINAICDRALLIAYGQDLRTIDRRLIRAAVRDIGPGYLTEVGPRRRTIRVVSAGLLAAVLLVVAGCLWYWGKWR